MEMIIEFAFFLLKALTITLLIFIPIFFIASSLKGKSEATDTLRIKNLSKKYMSMADSLKVLSLNKEETKKFVKASKCEEIILRLESRGGTVIGYGLCAAQLQRLREAKIKVTACVDKVAASGGYMMACVADKIISAPFAVIGSIGVVAAIPNFHKILKKNDIDYELHTAGEFKRTITTFGETTEEGRKKFK